MNQYNVTSTEYHRLLSVSADAWAMERNHSLWGMVDPAGYDRELDEREGRAFTEHRQWYIDRGLLG